MDRLARWVGWRCLSEPLVAILHARFLFVPAGFLLTGVAALWPEIIPAPAARHAWMAGAIAQSFSFNTGAENGETDV
jgi:uncharacterized protein involved in response to NO